MNRKQRKFINENYLEFIRSLPCAVKGKKEAVHSHHCDVIGSEEIRNDYYAIPVCAEIHVPNGNHITRADLEVMLNENIKERIIFYLSLYIEYLEGKYDPEIDETHSFLELRKMLDGFFAGQRI